MSDNGLTASEHNLVWIDLEMTGLLPDSDRIIEIAVVVTDAQAGTFGYMLGPLNRTVGLGTARQVQISARYLF